MSPRRKQVQNILSPRPVRRGFGASGGGGSSGNKLAFVAGPSGPKRNGIPGSGGSVRLQTSGGTNILLAGVPVTVALRPGDTQTMVTSPTIAVTDANGIAVFSSMTVSGLAGTYGVIYSAVGYASVEDLDSLTGGFAAAATTTAVVGPGTLGVLHPITATTRDALGNMVTVGGELLTRTITGANPRTTSDMVDNGDGTYSLGYTPGNAGTDTVAIRLSGVHISGSPFTSIVSAGGGGGGFGTTSLYIGWWEGQDSSLFAKGPHVSGGNWTTAAPLWRCIVGVIPVGEIVSALATATSQNILLVVRLGGNPGATMTGGSFDPQKYNDNVDAYLGISQLVTALATRQAVVLGTDEPWIAAYNNTFTPARVRDAFRHVKLRFPNSILTARMEPDKMRGGWAGSGTLPVNYFDKLDYGWQTYRGNTHFPSVGKTPAQTFAAGKATQNAAGYGCCYGVNWINLGDDTCWDANNTGSSNGRLEAQNGNDTNFVACSAPTTNADWVQEPDVFFASAVAAAADPDCPLFANWRHACSPFSNFALWKTLEQRSDFVARYVDAIHACEDRNTFNGWRVPK